MTFAEALAKLRSMTPGYCAMSFNLTIYDDGRMRPECSVYTEKHKWTFSPRETWEEALADLQAKIDGTYRDPLEGAPMGEVGG